MNVFQHANSHTSSALLALVLALGSGPALLSMSDDVQARERSGTVTGPYGRTATRQVQREAGSVNSTVTGPNGKSATRSVNRTAEGTQATVTGPNGETITRSVTNQP
jgi:hypothetical protein